MTICRIPFTLRFILKEPLGKYGTGTFAEKYTKLGHIIRHYGATVEAKEILHFNELSNDWWNELGIFKPLHSMNKLRIPLVRDGILNNTCVEHNQIRSPKPLRAFSILDVGCGGKF